MVEQNNFVTCGKPTDLLRTEIVFCITELDTSLFELLDPSRSSWLNVELFNGHASWAALRNL